MEADLILIKQKILDFASLFIEQFEKDEHRMVIVWSLFVIGS